MAGDLIVGYRIFQSGCPGENIWLDVVSLQEGWKYIGASQSFNRYFHFSAIADGLTSWDSAYKCVVSRTSSGPLLLYDIVEHSFQYRSQ